MSKWPLRLSACSTASYLVTRKLLLDSTEPSRLQMTTWTLREILTESYSTSCKSSVRPWNDWSSSRLGWSVSLQNSRARAFAAKLRRDWSLWDAYFTGGVVCAVGALLFHNWNNESSKKFIGVHFNRVRRAPVPVPSKPRAHLNTVCRDV